MYYNVLIKKTGILNLFLLHSPVHNTVKLI